MHEENLRDLLLALQSGATDIESAVSELSRLPYEDIGYARVDHHRALRTGMAEVVFAPGKTVTQIAGIVATMAAQKTGILVSRLEADAAGEVLTRLEDRRRAGERIPAAVYHEMARSLVVRSRPFEDRGRGTVAVVCAGTSDLPVATEALVTAEFFDNRAALITDVGVAGMHRLLSVKEKIADAEVIIAVAGMEGALPGVLAGLVARPIIGVPTSTGYGAAFGGVSALLTMLNSCAPGVTVVNIDNGYGAAAAATKINRRRAVNKG